MEARPGLKRAHRAPTSAGTMKLNLYWKRPLLWILLPILLFLVFVGFPPPFAPPRGLKAGQEQSAPAPKDLGDAGPSFFG